jgi:hypothetical protein
MDEQTTEIEPPDIGPAFVWRRRQAGWACYRVYFAARPGYSPPHPWGVPRRHLEYAALLAHARLEEIRAQIPSEMLAAFVASWVIQHCIERERKLYAQFPERRVLMEDAYQE